MGVKAAQGRRLFSSGSPFEAAAGYSRAVVEGDWCFVAGTTGYDYASMAIPARVEDQARQALATIAHTLEEAGFDIADVVRATYYLTEARHWSAVTPVLAEVFGTIRPAATCLIVGLIDPAMAIEIEVTALRRTTTRSAI